MDYSKCSDTDLRDALSGLRGVEARDGTDDTLAIVFGLVNEAVSRRLGAWRLFDNDFKHGALARYRELAHRAVEAGPYRSRVAYYTDDTFLDTESFRRSLEPLLLTLDLDRHDRYIVETMVYVAEKRKLQHESQILLPAPFYRAVAARLSEALRFRATDEQLQAGRLLYDRNVVEMNAGEGKTIAAAFPAVLHAVLDRRVHIITVNDYLASRDSRWLAPVYESLGLSVGTVLGHMGDAERRDAYRADIVYGALRELGFDFLRDRLRYAVDDLVQGPLEVAIVDEADQALIDEAGTPLIISGGPDTNTRSVLRIRSVIEDLIVRQDLVVADLEAQARKPAINERERRRLLAKLLLAQPHNALLQRRLRHDGRLVGRLRALADPDVADDPADSLTSQLHYIVDAKSETVTLTDRGQEYLEAQLGPLFDASDLEEQIAKVDADPALTLAARRRTIDSLMRRISRRHNRMNQAYQMLRAYTLLHRDVDYIVTGGQTVLVDKLTGRTRPDNRYQFGLQAALEAKERVSVRPESEVLAQISVQGLMRQYTRVAGMTGTALASADEFRRAYGLEVVVVPPSNPDRRTDLPSMLFTSKRDKLAAVVDQVKLYRRVGRPVLIGTLTVEQSDEVSRLLDGHGVEHKRLDAVNNAEEASVVKAAGSFGAVTVSTNMAGRGTDIVTEPGLDRRTTDRYVAMVRTALSGGAGSVILRCASPDEASVVEAALAAARGLSSMRRRLGGHLRVQVFPTGGGPPSGKAVEIDFGLGLCVIGTEMNDSRRVDLQLRGRSGRQGHFGSSRFILSHDDRALAFSDTVGSARSGEAQASPSGQAYHQGERTQRRLDKVQAAIELDGEVGRSVSRDFDQVVERQTEAYHRLRGEVLQSDSFHAAYLGFVRERARRLVESHFPTSMIDSYAALFNRFAEELWADYRVDADSLWELGIEAMKRELASLMAAGLDETRAESGPTRFDRIAKLLFVKTGDELRRDYLASLLDLMLSVRLCGHGHKATVAEFTHQAVEQDRLFKDQVIDTFLPRLFAVEADTATPRAAEVSVVEDVHEILV